MNIKEQTRVDGLKKPGIVTKTAKLRVVVIKPSKYDPAGSCGKILERLHDQ